MTYGDLLATVGLIIAIGAAVFTYVVIPPDKRAEGWAKIGMIAVAALTITCVGNLWRFATEATPPSRFEILQAIVYTIGAMGGWGSLLGWFFVWMAVRKNP